jgi:hypothetical protein
MYCHSLKTIKNGLELDIPCEDLAICDGVGIWPYDLNLAKDTYSDLLIALRNWANEQGFDYRLYTTRENFETNSKKKQGA